MKNFIKYFISILGIVFFSGLVVSQNNNAPKVEFGNQTITLKQNFTVTVTVPHSEDLKQPVFPVLKGFKILGVQPQESKGYFNNNGRVTRSHTIAYTCFYKPGNAGAFKFSDLDLTVSGKIYTLSKFEVKVITEKQRLQYQKQRREEQQRQQQRRQQQWQDQQRKLQSSYQDVSNEGQLLINTSSREVYLGEPIHMEVDFLIPMEKLKYAKPSIQELNEITEMMMAQRPHNCWEEVIPMDVKKVGSTYKYGGKEYAKFRLFEAVYYPISLETVEFKPVSINMKVTTKISSRYGRSQSGNKEFKARSVKIKVKDLPTHPLKDKVAVGNYYLKETIDSNKCHTGSAIGYEFQIKGEGNINAIDKPVVYSDRDVEILDGGTDIKIRHANGRVSGSKSYSYFLMPQEPGDYALSDYFEWIYFNYKTEQYDTLSPKKYLEVIGRSKQNEEIVNTKYGAFYDLINSADDTLESHNKIDILRLSTNVVAGLALCGVIGLFVYQRRRKDRNG